MKFGSICPTSEPLTKKMKLMSDSPGENEKRVMKLQNELVPTASSSSSSSSSPSSSSSSSSSSSMERGTQSSEIVNDDSKIAREIPAAAEGTDPCHGFESCTQSVRLAKGYRERRGTLVSVKVESSEDDEFSGEDSADWICVRCTSVNLVKGENCIACKLPRFQQSPVPGGQIEKWAHYRELIPMDETELCSNFMRFECPICNVECGRGEGIVLKNCLQAFCRARLNQTIQLSSESKMKCPFRNEEYRCEDVIQEGEIKALVTSEIYEFHSDRARREVEN